MIQEKVHVTFPPIQVEIEDLDSPDDGPGGQSVGDDVIDVDLVPPTQASGGLLASSDLTVKDWTKLRREVTANEVAGTVVRLFGWALFVSLLTGFALTGVTLLVDSTGTLAKTIIHDSFIPFIASAGDFVARIFGPLLGFILGYYFHRGSEK